MRFQLSVGLADCGGVNVEKNEKVIAELAKLSELAKVKNVNIKDPGEAAKRDDKLVESLIQARDNIGKIALEQGCKYGPLEIMAESGAKGSKANLIQIRAAIGQQVINGNIAQPVLYGNRCLPYFPLFGEYTPGSAGFCYNSFYQGLRPSEMIWHQMSSQEAELEKQSKVPESGDMRRRLVKALEEITYNKKDGTVRKGDKIVQFSYGGDGFDAGYLMNVRNWKYDSPYFIDIDSLCDKLNNE